MSVSAKISLSLFILSSTAHAVHLSFISNAIHWQLPWYQVICQNLSPLSHIWQTCPRPFSISPHNVRLWALPVRPAVRLCSYAFLNNIVYANCDINPKVKQHTVCVILPYHHGTSYIEALHASDMFLLCNTMVGHKVSQICEGSFVWLSIQWHYLEIENFKYALLYFAYLP